MFTVWFVGFIVSIILTFLSHKLDPGYIKVSEIFWSFVVALCSWFSVIIWLCILTEELNNFFKHSDFWSRRIDL